MQSVGGKKGCKLFGNSSLSVWVLNFCYNPFAFWLLIATVLVVSCHFSNEKAVGKKQEKLDRYGFKSHEKTS